MARKYEVSGTDAEGDRWTFTTESRERAEDVHAQMREDLQDVELKER
ncbi:MAG: hypothetical protein ACK4K7_02955 [Allosphingosinicella sp.]